MLCDVMQCNAMYFATITTTRSIVYCSFHHYYFYMILSLPWLLPYITIIIIITIIVIIVTIIQYCHYHHNYLSLSLVSLLLSSLLLLLYCDYYDYDYGHHDVYPVSIDFEISSQWAIVLLGAMLAKTNPFKSFKTNWLPP